MDINDTIRELDAAREEYARVNRIDKISRWLILGALAVVTGAFALAVIFQNGDITLLLVPALFAWCISIPAWCYANIGTSDGTLNRQAKADRLSRARKRLDAAEKAHEQAALGEGGEL